MLCHDTHISLKWIQARVNIKPFGLIMPCTMNFDFFFFWGKILIRRVQSSLCQQPTVIRWNGSSMAKSNKLVHFVCVCFYCFIFFFIFLLFFFSHSIEFATQMNHNNWEMLLIFLGHNTFCRHCSLFRWKLNLNINTFVMAVWYERVAKYV